MKEKLSGLVQKIKNMKSGLNNRDGYGTVCYRIYSCPKCSQKLRVPKGVGRIEITCKRCGWKFIKRS